MSWGPLCVQLSMEIKIQKCIETLNNILSTVVAKHFEKRVWVFFFQEDYAPLSIMLYKLDIEHQSNSIMLRHKYSKVFEEFCKYVLRDASMTPKINPFGWHHSENIPFISSTQYWKRILKFTITNTECFITKQYNRCLYMYIYFQEILVSLFVVYIN